MYLIICNLKLSTVNIDRILIIPTVNRVLQIYKKKKKRLVAKEKKPFLKVPLYIRDDNITSF